MALAHELGHVLLHSEYNLFDKLDCNLRKKLDDDADTFAQILLNRGNYETKKRH